MGKKNSISSYSEEGQTFSMPWAELLTALDAISSKIICFMMCFFEDITGSVDNMFFFFTGLT